MLTETFHEKQTNFCQHIQKNKIGLLCFVLKNVDFIPKTKYNIFIKLGGDRHGRDNDCKGSG